MAFTKTHLVLLIVSITILFAPTSNAIVVRTPQARVWMMCKPTTNPLLCYKTILPKALDTPKFNMYKALEAEVLATEAQVLKTAGTIATSMFKFANDKNIADSLNICKDQYDSIVDSIKLGITALSKRYAGEVRFRFSSVISLFNSCQDAFVEGKIVAPFADDAKIIHDLAANCLDISKAIEDKEMLTSPPVKPGLV